jgi:hypothetical protein
VSYRPQWNAWAAAWCALRQKDQSRTKAGAGGARPDAGRAIRLHRRRRDRREARHAERGAERNARVAEQHRVTSFASAVAIW